MVLTPLKSGHWSKEMKMSSLILNIPQKRKMWKKKKRHMTRGKWKIWTTINLRFDRISTYNWTNCPDTRNCTDDRSKKRNKKKTETKKKEKEGKKGKEVSARWNMIFFFRSRRRNLLEWIELDWIKQTTSIPSSVEEEESVVRSNLHRPYIFIFSIYFVHNIVR